MAHVLLSHSSADSKGAAAMAQLLRNAGLEVWLSLDQLTPGEQWQPALEHALKDSSHFVVLVGESGVQRWVDLGCQEDPVQRLQNDLVLGRCAIRAWKPTT